MTPLRAFPVVRDLVTDVGFNYTKAREVPAFVPPAGVGPGEYRMMQEDVDRSQEFRKCIECFLCQDTCHVVRDHEENKQAFAGPRFLMRVAELDMHPLDAADGDGPGPQGHRPGRTRPRLLQHHQVLHGGLPRGHQDHGQRADPAEGTGGRPQVRPAGVAGIEDQEALFSRLSACWRLCSAISRIRPGCGKSPSMRVSGPDTRPMCIDRRYRRRRASSRPGTRSAS